MKLQRSFYLALLFALFGATASISFFSNLIRSDRLEKTSFLVDSSFIGPRVKTPGNWIGDVKASKSLSFLIMAGHADSQGINGSGTSGEAVALRGASPMDSSMKDELFWNIKVRDSVVKIGTSKGLKIASYDPVQRTILDENDPRTNWSVGFKHAQMGGYVLEIHFDAYGKDGFGSGLIPPFSGKLNTVDESLAISFGRYPRLFRGGLGAAKRQIRILEVGKLEGLLEKNLRDPLLREETIEIIATKITDALLKGVGM